MIKKFVIIISIIFFLLYGIYSALYSLNFLVPTKVSRSEIANIFRNDLLCRIKNVYAFCNLKHQVTIYEVDDIRCNVWRIKEYNFLPEFDEAILLDSIPITNCVIDSQFLNPHLKIFKKQFGSFTEVPKLVFDKHINCCRIKTTSEKLSIFGEIKSFGLFNENNVCEVKYQFDKETKAKLVFLKRKGDYYVVLYYGMNGHVINSATEILNEN